MKNFFKEHTPRKGLVINAATAAVVAAAGVLIFLNVRTDKPDEKKAEGEEITVSVEICCPQVFEEKNYERLDGKVKESGLLDGGETLAECEISVGEGATMMDALTAACGECELEMDVAHSQMYGDYLRGIGGLAEGACTKRSGWVYMVNGDEPDLAINKITAEDGDQLRVEFVVF